VLTLAVTTILAACGGADASSGLASLQSGEAGTESTTTTAAATSSDEAILEFASCMRENGVPDFPDPQLDSQGGFGAALPEGVDPRSEEFQTAQEACRDILEGAAFGPGGPGGDFDPSELQDRLLEFAQCMRDNGITDFPDPDLDNFRFIGPDEDESGTAEGDTGPQVNGGGPFGDIDLDDPTIQAALETCSEQTGLPAPGEGPPVTATEGADQ
jgi:hypothetical protein